MLYNHDSVSHPVLFSLFGGWGKRMLLLTPFALAAFKNCVQFSSLVSKSANTS